MDMRAIQVFQQNQAVSHPLCSRNGCTGSDVSQLLLWGASNWAMAGTTGRVYGRAHFRLKLVALPTICAMPAETVCKLDPAGQNIYLDRCVTSISPRLSALNTSPLQQERTDLSGRAVSAAAAGPAGCPTPRLACRWALDTDSLAVHWQR